jgi:hypothetical protein
LENLLTLIVAAGAGAVAMVDIYQINFDMKTS